MIKLLRRAKQHPVGEKLLEDLQYRTVVLAVGNLILSLLYALYHGALGLLQGSVWFLASCVYYLLLSAMRFAAVLTPREKSKQLMLTTGLLLPVLGVVLAGMLAISLYQDTATVRGEIYVPTVLDTK